MVSCTHCGVSNRDGRKFCSACGGSLASGCSACGAPLEAGDRFCGQCRAAVPALGDELGVQGLRARAGVLTGEAAVTIGATGEGMVAGDLVNTASRVQSAAEPGEVFVGEATRRATERTIVFEDAGSHPFK